MAKTQYSLIRRSIVVLLILGASLPWLIRGSQRSFDNVVNAPINWLPETFPARAEFDRFARDFGTQHSIVVGWPGCTVDDERLARFVAVFQSDRLASSGERYSDLVYEVADGGSAVRQLMSEPLSLSRDEATRRLTGVLVGSDGKSSCAIVSLSELGIEHRRSIVDLLSEAAEREAGVDREELRFAGSEVDGLAIDRENVRSLQSYALPSALISTVICCICLRSWILASPVLIVGGFGGMLVLAMIHYSGGTMNAILAVVPPLVFVLTMSAGVHLVNYFHDEVDEHGLKASSRRAIAAGWKPCWLATVTTAIGLGALAVSDVIPVKQFGIYAAIGVLATTGLLFLLVPVGMEIWLMRYRARRASSGRSDDSIAAGETPEEASTRHGWTGALTRISTRAWAWVMVPCLAAIVAGAAGLRYVETSVDVRKLLSPELRASRDYAWLEDQIGSLVPLEVVVRFDPTCNLDILERAQMVKALQDEVAKADEVGGTISPITFMPPVRTSGSLGATTGRVIMRRRLARHLPELEQAHWVHADGEIQSWRIMATVRALGDADYGALLERLPLDVGGLLDESQAEGVDVSFTGVVPVVYAAQEALLVDMFSSFLTALVLVGMVMMVLQRSLIAGLIAMLPNIFPAVVTFGTMGWCGFKVDIGTVMTASVALGIAVDDTIHFLSWFSRARCEGATRPQAVGRALRLCAPAMLQTTLICGLGMLVFALSDFIPMRRFAWMMFGLLALALVGDLLLLPAILVSPLGRFFPQRMRGGSASGGA